MTVSLKWTIQQRCRGNTSTSRPLCKAEFLAGTFAKLNKILPARR